MSGDEIDGLRFMVFVFGWTAFCCAAGYLMDRLAEAWQ